jgi:hypothetical protein
MRGIIGSMARINPAFEWSHVLPSGKIVTNLTATREELLQVIRDVKADAAGRLAEAHHRTIHARRLWAEKETPHGRWPSD